MMHVKESLLLIGKRAGLLSRYVNGPLMPYNRK